MATDWTPLPPREAIAFFRAKGYRVGFSWRDTAAGQHAQAFTVAKAMRLDVLEAIRQEVDLALSEGRTFDQFRSELAPKLKKLGWWGRHPMTDPLTGDVIEAQLGSTRRLRIIYDTNLRVSYAVGRWTAIQRSKRRLPWLRYQAVLDARTRPRHRAWHGTVLPVDHEFWKTHFPPNGWRCRCTVQQLTNGDLERMGLTPTDPPPPVKPGPAHTNRTTGEVVTAPEGIDPGWGHNVGAAADGRFPDPAKFKDPDWGHRAAEISVDSPHFDEIVQGTTEGSAPVGWLDDTIVKALDVDVRRVDLSADTMRKQRGELPTNPGHPELTVEDYRRLPEIVRTGRVVADHGRSLIIYADVGTRMYRAVVKVTATGEAAFLVSLTRSTQDQRERQSVGRDLIRSETQESPAG